MGDTLKALPARRGRERDWIGYRSGRSEAWVKVKDRFTVVGFVPDGVGGLAKLRLARREGRALVYAGRVGTGWDYTTARAIRRALAPLA